MNSSLQTFKNPPIKNKKLYLSHNLSKESISPSKNKYEVENENNDEDNDESELNKSRESHSLPHFSS